MPFIPISQNKLKYFSRLQNKKDREREGLFLLEGKKLLAEAIKEKVPLRAVVISEKLDLHNLEDLGTMIEGYICKENEFKRLSQLENSEGVLAVAAKIEHTFPQDIHNKKFFVLDHVQDPGNLGTILRICDAFNIDGVILHECVEIYNPKVVRASMGAIFRVPFYYVSVPNIIKQYSSKMLKSELSGIPITQIPIKQYQFIVLGNEASGLISEWNPKIPQSISIPQSGKAESLNVAIACGILAWEWSK